MTRVPTASTPASTLTSGLTSTLAGKATMTSNSASTVSALPYETSTCTLSTFPQTPASSCTRTPAPTTESTPASQHGSSTTSDSTIDSLGMAWTRATLVRAALFAPLSSSNIGRIKTLFVDFTGSLGAHWETLSRAQETLAPTLTEHYCTSMPLRCNLSPSFPWNTATTATAATFTSPSTTRPSFSSTAGSPSSGTMSASSCHYILC